MPKISPKIHFYDEEKLKNINPETMKLWNKYKVDMSLRELSEKTIAGYENDCQHWFIYIHDQQGNQCVTDLDEDDITQFLYFCKTQGNNSRRMKRRISSISAFYKFLRKKRIIQENPMEFISRPTKDTDVAVQTYLTKEQVGLMREKLKANGDLLLEIYAMFSLSTMARVNAVAHIRWDQINFESRIVENVLEKEGKYVTLYFSEEVKVLLMKLYEQRIANQLDDGGWVFYSKLGDKIQPITTSSLSQWCKKIGNMIGVPTLHAHDFRHSGATLLKNMGMSLEDVSALLNHAGTDVTSKYYLKVDSEQISKNKDKFIF